MLAAIAEQREPGCQVEGIGRKLPPQHFLLKHFSYISVCNLCGGGGRGHKGHAAHGCLNAELIHLDKLLCKETNIPSILILVAS